MCSVIIVVWNIFQNIDVFSCFFNVLILYAHTVSVWSKDMMNTVLYMFDTLLFLIFFFNLTSAGRVLNVQDLFAENFSFCLVPLVSIYLAGQPLKKKRLWKFSQLPSKQHL